MPIELTTGAILGGRYRLDRMIGEGGMGVVWSAMHVVTRKPVALKLLLPSGDLDWRLVQRFLREARAACAVQHPNIVVIHDVLELDDSTPMMVMELLEGESLGGRLDREPLLPIGELARILLPVVSAVGTAHASGIVHRDLKPDNIFLSRTPDGPVVKVLDFGIAKLAPTDNDGANTGGLTGSGAMLGTPYYMAPEQIFGERDIDYRADVWSLGIIMFECLAGARPTQADNIGQILKIVTTDKVPKLANVVPDLPQDVTALVDRMLSRDREGRPTLHVVRELLSHYSDVSVRSFNEPVAPRISRTSLPPADASDSHRILVRTGDPVNPMGATHAVDPALSASMMKYGVATLSATTKETPPKTRRSVMIALIAAGVVAAGVVAAIVVPGLAKQAPVPSVSAVNASAPPSVSASVAVSAPVPPATAPSTLTSASAVPSSSALRIATVKLPSVKTSTAASITSPASSTAHPGGVVDKPPF